MHFNGVSSLMVIEVETPGGGGGPFDKIHIPTEEEIEEVKKVIDQFKVLWPLLAIPLFAWFRKKNKKGDITESIEWVAVTNFLTGYSDYIIALGWILLARVNGTVNKLSYVFVGAETVPTVELNLPKGVMLGSWFVTGEYAIEFAKNLGGDVADLIETGHTQETTGSLDILIASILTVTGLDKVLGIKK